LASPLFPPRKIVSPFPDSHLPFFCQFHGSAYMLFFLFSRSSFFRVVFPPVAVPSPSPSCCFTLFFFPPPLLPRFLVPKLVPVFSTLGRTHPLYSPANSRGFFFFAIPLSSFFSTSVHHSMDLPLHPLFSWRYIFAFIKGNLGSFFIRRYILPQEISPPLSTFFLRYFPLGLLVIAFTPFFPMP